VRRAIDRKLMAMYSAAPGQSAMLYQVRKQLVGEIRVKGSFSRKQRAMPAWDAFWTARRRAECRLAGVSVYDRL
jgi:hypothetical protein